VRLFIAIAVPGHVKQTLAAIQDDLKAVCPRSLVKWTRPEQIHLTLEFLGEVGPDQLELLKDAMRQAVRTFTALPMQALGTGAFPDLRRPRVLWVRLDSPDRRLIELQERLHPAVAPFVEFPEERAFTPHLTLARVKQMIPEEAAALRSRLDSVEKQVWGQWTARSVDLMQSLLRPEGSTHECLFSIPFIAE
jgi:RNA 2',3'-cyclic 3'-phosphodiesterase